MIIYLILIIITICILELSGRLMINIEGILYNIEHKSKTIKLPQNIIDTYNIIVRKYLKLHAYTMLFLAGIIANVIGLIMAGFDFRYMMYVNILAAFVNSANIVICVNYIKINQQTKVLNQKFTNIY